MMVSLWMSRYDPPTEKDAVRLIGPVRLPRKKRVLYPGWVELLMKGLPVLKSLFWSLSWAEPWNLSVPGLVKISMRPKPGRSYSAEKGF